MIVPQKIKDGTYLLIWTDHQDLTVAKEEIKFDDIQSSYTLELHHIWGASSREMVQLFVRSKPWILSAVQPKTTAFKKTVSFASLIEYAPAPASGPTPMKVSTINLIHNHVNQLMKKEHSSKWSLTLNTDNPKSGRTPINFVLVFDFIPVKTPLLKPGFHHVLSHMTHLWDTKVMSDVTFKMSGESIEAHTLILASGSPVLEAMFLNDCRETRERVVEIEDFDFDVVETMFEFIYLGDVDLDSVDVFELLMAAEKYAVLPLKEECAHYLIGKLSVTNAVKCLILSHLNQVPNLNKAALEFMSKKAKSICGQSEWKAAIKNYPDLCFNAMQVMAKENV